MRQLYSSVVIPKMTYTMDIWNTLLYRIKGQKNTYGSVRVTGKLASIQRMASVVITGALKTTATDTLDLHANLLPVDLTLHKICHKAAVHLATLLELHPLHALYHQRTKKHIKSHRSSLQELPYIYDIIPDTYETLTLVHSDPQYEKKCRTEIVDTAEESIKRDRLNESDVIIYADGSGIKGKAGAAAVIYRGDGTPKVLRYCLGPLTEHTTFDTEAIGITLAAHLLGQEKNVWRATISLDNQVVITSLDTGKPKSGQNVIGEFLQQIERKWKRSNKATYWLDVTWVKGHLNIEGNERVDEEAKKAAKGKMSKERKLPGFLSESPPPLSTSAICQEYERKLKEEWKARWEELPQHLKLSRIDPSMPSNKYNRLTEGLRRLQASLIMQLRTGHVVLNKYLH
jgi:ribonuclease HI